MAVPDPAGLARPASVGQVGGFRPSDDPRTSWAGKVTVARPEEGWPLGDGQPPEYREAWRNARGDEATAARAHDGLKVGGWPATVQSAVDWWEADERLDDVDFVLQVGSDEKTGFQIGYGGVLYIGRRRSTGTWHCSWQSM